MRTILCMLLLWQTCTPLCMPRSIGLPNFSLSLRWQTCESLCMPHLQAVCRISLHRFSDRHACSSACPVGFACRISLRTPLHAPSDWSAVFHFVSPLIGVRAIYMFLLLTYAFSHSHETWHCLCYWCNGSCSCTCHDTNPPWYKLKAPCCNEGIPKRFCNDETMVWIFLRCKTQTWKLMCGCLPDKRIVCSASKVTTCSSVYQTCQVVVNSMLHQQGDNTIHLYQSSYATAIPCQTRWQSR